MLLEKNSHNLSIIAFVVVLFVLAGIIVRPFAYSLILAILLAYIFYPVYRWTLKIVKYPNLAAMLMCLLLLIIVLAPLIFIFGALIDQVRGAYLWIQMIDFQEFFTTNIPLDSEFVKMIGSYVNNSIPKITSLFLSRLGDFVMSIPLLLIRAFVILFVFFFSLRDGERALAYIRSMSPFSKDVENKFFIKFKEVTNSVLLGQVVVGVLQGLVAGIGYFIFGVQNALSLTLLTMLVATIPIIGAWLVWVPVDFYLFTTGEKGAAIGLLIYGLFIVSWIDNIVRPLIVSKRTDINSAIVVVGMLGGLFVFGIVGMIIGPLILGYILLVLEIYRKKSGENVFLKEVKEEPMI